MPPAVLQATFAFLLVVAAGCRNDFTTPDPSPQDGRWAASGSPSVILRLDPTQLSGTGEREPATTLTTPSARLEPLVDVAFDVAGDMWVTSPDDAVLLAFAPGAQEARARVGSKASGVWRACDDRS